MNIPAAIFMFLALSVTFAAMINWKPSSWSE